MANTKNTRQLSVYISAVLYAELQAEAWEEHRTVSDYVRKLLSTRGKWARSTGTAGGYAIQKEISEPE